MFNANLNLHVSSHRIIIMRVPSSSSSSRWTFSDNSLSWILLPLLLQLYASSSPSFGNGVSSEGDEEKRSRCGEIVANIDKYEVVVFPSHIQEDQAQWWRQDPRWCSVINQFTPPRTDGWTPNLLSLTFATFGQIYWPDTVSGLSVGARGYSYLPVPDRIRFFFCSASEDRGRLLIQIGLIFVQVPVLKGIHRHQLIIISATTC